MFGIASNAWSGLGAIGLCLPMLAMLATGRGPAPSPCSAPIPGLAAHLQRGNLLWFGEIHGTEESPRFVGDVVCEAAQRGPVQLGLEIWDVEQPNLDRYLRSAGTEADRAVLLAGTFWGLRDGRGSHAMIALLDRVRRLREAGATVEIVAFDSATARERDAAMAEAVVNARDAGGIFIGLSGNVHSRRVSGTEWDPELVPAVAHLVRRGLPVTTFDVSSTGGTHWGCVGESEADSRCGVFESVGDGDEEPAWTITLPSRDDTHDGAYHVGAIQASPPARGEHR